jgi:microcystin-dependent protein
MTVTITHNFVSAKSDGVDNTLVQPSNWGTAATNAANSTHTLSMAGGGNVLGRTTAGAGVPTELAASTQGLAILSAADIPTLIALGIPVFSTGDAKLTYKTTADPGWILVINDGTIGKAGSGATIRANADTQALYVLFYSNISDTLCPVSGGRTGNAVNDFNNAKTILVPRLASRALVSAGNGSGLSGWALGLAVGEENHVLTGAEMPTHTHGVTDPGHSHTYQTNSNNANGSLNVGGASFMFNDVTQSTGLSLTSISIQNAGSGAAHNNLQPSSALNVMIKL